MKDYLDERFGDVWYGVFYVLMSMATAILFGGSVGGQGGEPAIFGALLGAVWPFSLPAWILWQCARFGVFLGSGVGAGWL